MEDYLDFLNRRSPGSFVEINEPQQEGFSSSTSEAFLDAYGQKLRSVAEMLFHSDWYSLKKGEETFETVIAGIKDVIEGISDIDGVSLVEQALEALYAILECLHIAGERSGEIDFDVRTKKHGEFTHCHRSLIKIAKQLCKKMS